MGLQEAQALGRGMGIASMRYRAGLVGARLELESAPGAGTAVRCSLLRDEQKPSELRDRPVDSQ